MPDLTSKSEKLINQNAETALEKLLNSPFFKKAPEAGWANYKKQSLEAGSLYIHETEKTNELLISENGGLGGSAEFRVFLKIEEQGQQKSLMTLHFKSGLFSVSTIKWLFILLLPVSAFSFYFNEIIGFVLVLIEIFFLIMNLLNWHTQNRFLKAIDASLKQTSDKTK
ncbi:hypothetical protein [Prolixibacter denitrificans]|uniref:Uncharacterized protein n=1 Tax=Prolixibacter denitrificans TaxID=1541063 RepID=A0A2P8CE06_9BACT|nr:hypothetical protein [Prolixibacter denitrificans]PSK83217.1 hypothetical protein CLV93_104147 [Prolixibacter denitrificans]GET21900.1 hypothetical protein JCM18694_21460 [Prolixibacter denitrificans]